jgi:hypothetical protein
MCPKWGRSAALVFMVLFPGPSANAQKQRPTVIVYVYNNAKASESLLAETAGYVRGMFDKAGIELVWRNSMAMLRNG